MAWLRTIEKRNNPQASELSQLIEELRRVYEKLESPRPNSRKPLRATDPPAARPVGNRELATDIRPVPSLSW